MQNYSGSSNLSTTVFFTAEVEGSHVYQVSAFATATGSGDGVTVNILRNGHVLGGPGGEPGDYIFDSLNVLLTNGDELSFNVDVDGSVSWQLQLRLVRILDELNPL